MLSPSTSPFGRAALATAVLVALTTFAPRASAESPPPGVHEESRARTGLVLAGAATFATSYGAALVFLAAEHERAGDDPMMPSVRLGPNGLLAIPFVGPFFQMSGTEVSTAGNIVYATDGILQIAGAAMAVVGISWRAKVLVPDGAAEARVAPIRVGQGGTGLGLVGTF